MANRSESHPRFTRSRNAKHAAAAQEALNARAILEMRPTRAVLFDLEAIQDWEPESDTWGQYRN